jgi:hypothetical protein
MLGLYTRSRIFATDFFDFFTGGQIAAIVKSTPAVDVLVTITVVRAIFSPARSTGSRSQAVG